MAIHSLGKSYGMFRNPLDRGCRLRLWWQEYPNGGVSRNGQRRFGRRIESSCEMISDREESNYETKKRH